jgi:hypothetical protein
MFDVLLLFPFKNQKSSILNRQFLPPVATLNLLERMVKHGVSKFVIAPTSAL